MTSEPPKQRRRRGIILTDRGWEKLQTAKQTAEIRENRGNRFTLEMLAEKTGLAVDTLMKVLARELGVDKQTLKQCFRSFQISLDNEDYYRPDPETANPTLSPEFPEGQVPLHSSFYLERGSIERDCYRAIECAGSLIRIKAPKRMGKTSLVTRILAHAHQQGYHTVYLSLQLAENRLFNDLDQFLRWFCANIALEVGLTNPIDDYWDDLFGCKMSCKIYFEQFILANLDRPLALALDDIDRLFQHPLLADDFFGLLRSWHEEGKNKAIWQKLRLIVAHAHATEVYTPLNINQSPFNVGLSIELPPLTSAGVTELAHRYGIAIDADSLLGLVGGNPYLVRLALYHIALGDRTLDTILATPVTDDRHLYKDHLQRQLWNFQQMSAELRSAFEKVVMSAEAIEIDLLQAFQLHSLGLVSFQGNLVVPSCSLYSRYFRSYFRQGNSSPETPAVPPSPSIEKPSPQKSPLTRSTLKEARNSLHAG